MDGGDSFRKGKTADELRAKTVLNGMAMMGYDALNIGDGELSLGEDFFGKLSSEAKVPMLSCNLTGLPNVVPFLVKKVGGVKVAITGVTAGSFLTPDADKSSGIRVVSQVDALKELLPKLRQQADMVILLSHLGYEGTVNLLQFNDIKGVDVAVAAHGRNLLDLHPTTMGGTTIVQNSMGGEYLGLLRLRLLDSGLIEVGKSEVIPLNDTMPEDRVAKEMMDDFHTKETKALFQNEQKGQEQFDELKTKYLSMSPQQFIEELKKKRAGTAIPAPKAPEVVR